MSTERTVLDPDLLRIFGSDDDPIVLVETRARRHFDGQRIIVWEGDPTTFAFSYVSADAEAMLGFPAQRWVADAAFWTSYVVHPEERADAVAFCALATGRKADHVFEYRAMTSSGDVIWLRDYVRVVIGTRGVPIRLRGLMVDVTNEKASSPSEALRLPSVAALSLKPGPTRTA